MPKLKPATLRAFELSEASGLWRWRLAGGVMTFSRGMFALLGLDEARGMPGYAALKALVHPEDLAGLLERLRAAATGDRTHALAFRIVRPGGGVRWIVGAADAEVGDDGAIVAVVGSARDVTAHLLTDDALRRSEDRLRQTIDGVDAIIVYRANDDDPLVFSGQLRRILGYDPASFTSFDHWNAVVDPDDLPRCQAVWATAPVTWTLEYRVRRSDGEWIWVVDRGRRTRESSGRGAGVFSVITDVTERRLAVARIAASEARLRRIYDAGLVGIAAVAEDGVVTEANAYFARMVGADPDQLGSVPPVDALTADPDLRAAIRAAIAEDDDRAATPREATLVRRDGSQIEALVAVSSASRGGEAFLVALDVTEMRDLEARIRQLDRLEAVGNLTAGIAHHFNNILTGALGYSELARDAMAPGQARDDLDAALAISQRAVDLTRQLLAFGRRERLAPTVIDVRDVIDGLAPSLPDLLAADTVLEIARTDAPCLVRFERRRLEDVLTSLAANAGEAMPDGGRLAIATSLVEHEGGTLADGTTLTSGRYVRIVLADSGAGMDAQTLARVFEPFFTTKDPSRGLGMGVPAAYGIVREGDGDLRYESAPGAGTVVTIELPCAPSPPAAEGAVSPSPG